MKNKKDTSFCPDELRPLFKMVNKLPQDLNKFENDLNQIYTRGFAEFQKAGQPDTKNLGLFYAPNEVDSIRVQSKHCKLLRQQIPPELAAFYNEFFESNDFFNALFQLRLLINEKRTLLTIIQSFQGWDKGYNRQLIPQPTFNLEVPLSAFSFNEDTSLALLSFRVLEILTKDKIPIKRIRICRACKNIFWAKRSDSPTCSKKCLNTFNKRKSRNIQQGEKYIKQYNEGVENLKKLKKEQNGNPSLIQKQIAQLDNLRFKLEMLRREYVTLQTPEQ
jgi:hypothetical protein